MQPVRKFTALLLAICMIAVTLPITVSASGGTPLDLQILDVDSYVANSVVTTSTGLDISSVTLPTDYDVYVINGGTATQPYLVNIDTIRFLPTVTVSGSGYVKWKDYGLRWDQCGPDDAFYGIVPVSKLNDPVYMEMALPNDGEYFWCDFSLDYKGPRRGGTLRYNNRKNGFNMVQPREDHLNMINMGAFYLNYEETPPALTDTITLCIKDMKMFVHKQGDPADQWTLMSERAIPTASQVGNQVKISWSGGNHYIYDRWSVVGDHCELALTGADLWTGDADWKENANHQYLIHFWDSQVTFASIGIEPEEVDGVICSYIAWVKEDNMANKLLATSGADLRPGLWPENYEDWQAVLAGTLQKNPYKDSNKDRSYIGDTVWNGQSANQTVSSRGAALPSSPKLIYCHSVEPATYDDVLDTAYVQRELLGMTRTLDVDKYVATSVVNTTTGWDISGVTLPDGYDEYIIHYGTADKPYLLNDESMRVLAKAKVSGDGYIKWKEYIPRTGNCTQAKSFSGVISAVNFNDPVRREMAMPTDADYYWCDQAMNSYGPRRNGNLKYDNRKNGYNGVLPRGSYTLGGQTVAHDSAYISGLFFLNYEEAPPALTDAITLCLKDMKLYLHKQGESSGTWHTLSVASPSTTTVRKTSIDTYSVNVNLADRCALVGDHVEIALTGADFRTSHTDWKDNASHQNYIRIFDAPGYFADLGIDASQIDGILCTYTAWVKEEAMANKVVGTVTTELRPGLWPEKYADWQDAKAGLITRKPFKQSGAGSNSIGEDTWNGNTTNTAVASRGVCLAAEQTPVFCHNAYDSIYSDVVDTKAVQALVGLTDGLDVDDYVADSKVETTAGWDISSVSLPTGMDKYVINGGTAAKPYLVSAETLCQLADANVEGTGYVKWIGYNARSSHCTQAKSITGVVPVDKLSDPIYMEMALPSDDDFYFCDLTMDSSGPRRGGILKWNNRKNGYNGVLPRTAHTISGQTVAHDSMNNAGVIYLNYNEAPPAQNAAFTLCVKDVKVYLHKQGDAANNWRLLTDTDLPTVYKTSFSWSVNTNLASRRTVVGDHVEIALTGADLWTGQSDWKDVGSHQLYLRLWDQPAYFTSVGITDPSQIDGIVCTYTAWVKEASAADKLVATVTGELRPGLWPEVYTDWQNAIAGLNDKRPFKPSGASNSSQGDATWNGTTTNTAVASRGVTLTTTPRVVFCHSVYPGVYDQVLDTNTVQTLLGLN